MAFHRAEPRGRERDRREARRVKLAGASESNALQISYADSPGTYNAPRGANVLFYAARVNLDCRSRDQVCVFSFSPCLHWALNFAYCSGVRIPLAVSVY